MSASTIEKAHEKAAALRAEADALEAKAEQERHDEIKCLVEPFLKPGEEVVIRGARKQSSENGSRRTRTTKDEVQRRERQMLAILAENPGTTAAAFGATMGMSAATVHQTFNKLKKQGLIKQTEKGREVVHA